MEPASSSRRRPAAVPLGDRNCEWAADLHLTSSPETLAGAAKPAACACAEGNVHPYD